MRRMFAMVLLAAGASTARAQIFNGGMPSGFTCAGYCGVSGADGVVPLAPLGGTQYGWISTYGTYNGTSPADPLGITGSTNGSILTSPTFAATAGQALSFRFDYVTSDGGQFDDFAFVRLLGGAGGPLTLFSARTWPTGNTVPGTGLPALAPGVSLAPASTPVIAGAPNFTPLGPDYNNTCYDVGCGWTGWVRAIYTMPTAGNFRLEFGVFNLLDAWWDSALAIDYALGTGGTPYTDPEDGEGDGNTVTPEPSSLVLLAAGLSALALAIGTTRRRRA